MVWKGQRKGTFAYHDPKQAGNSMHRGRQMLKSRPTDETASTKLDHSDRREDRYRTTSYTAARSHGAKQAGRGQRHILRTGGQHMQTGLATRQQRIHRAPGRRAARQQ